MNICLLAYYFPARSETFILEHAIGLRRRGHQVTVIARKPDSAVTASEIAALDAIGIVRVYTGEFASPKLNAVRALWTRLRFPQFKGLLSTPDHDARQECLIALAECRAIRRITPDVVHIHYGDHASALLGIAGDLINPSRCIVTWHGYDINATKVVNYHQGYAQLLSMAVRHTVGSIYVRRKLEHLGARSSAVSVIPMGIDLNRFTYRPRYYRPGETLRILSVGRLEEVKGHHVLIAAVARLVSKGVPVVLRIAGDGRLADLLQRQIDQAELGRHVTLLGAVPSAQVVEEMHAAHLFALTGVAEASGKVESQGVVYAEAQATGLPVIGSDLGGVPEVMVDGRTGKLCAPGDVAAVSEAILSFVEDAARIAVFGEAGRRLVEDAFSCDHMLDRFEVLYGQAIVRPPGQATTGAR